jgi:Fe2+ or Zn2+ uptake regulation protein
MTKATHDQLTREPAPFTAALARLRAARCRVTEPRLALLRVLVSSTRPLLISDLVAAIPSADEASVYRGVATFRALGLLEEITDAAGRRRYSLRTDEEHHHHIVCADCGRAAHVPCLAVSESSPPHHPDFPGPLTHEVTYFGQCRDCVKRSPRVG